MQNAVYELWPLVWRDGIDTASAVISTAVMVVPLGSSANGAVPGGGLATVQSWPLASVYFTSVAKRCIPPVAPAEAASTTEMTWAPPPKSWQGTISLS